MTAILVIGLAPIVGALFCVTVAGIKNRDVASWFLLGLLASVVSAVAICWLPALEAHEPPATRRRPRR